MQKLALIAILVASSFSTLMLASADDPVSVSAKLLSVDSPNVKVEVGLDVTEPGFRVYRDTVRVVADGAEIVGNEMPAGKTRRDPLSKHDKEIFEGKVTWPIVIKPANAAAKEIEVSVTYRACNNVLCHFPKTKKIKVGTDKKEIRASIGDAISSFWHLVTSIDSDQIKLLASDNMWFALLLCFVSGILTSLTPCVYPMIPITISIFGRMARESETKRKFNPRVFGISAVYVAGMSFTYSVMGLVAGMTGSLFGKILQSPVFLGALTLLFFALALGQFGLFKLELPVSLQTKLSRGGHTNSAFGVFMMGLFSGLIVSPCVGPVIAGILAFVFDTSNALKGLLYFFSFSLGLGVLFLLIGGFSGLLSALPRSGNWMTRVNRVLALLMLFAAGYYATLFWKQIRPSHVETIAASDGWGHDEKAAYAMAAQRRAPIVLDFTAEWCEACHVLDKQVFQNDRVKEQFSHVVLLRIDVTQENATNEEILKRYGVQSLPAVVFVDAKGTILKEPRVHGVVSPESFLETLSNVLKRS